MLYYIRINTNIPIVEIYCFDTHIIILTVTCFMPICRLNIRIRRRGVQTAAVLNMRGKKDRQTLIVRVQYMFYTFRK